jgi:hypothetical protein
MMNLRPPWQVLPEWSTGNALAARPACADKLVSLRAAHMTAQVTPQAANKMADEMSGRVAARAWWERWLPYVASGSCAMPPPGAYYN